MELGNLIFGHSRGTYPIERNVGFEEALYRLFEAVSPKSDTSWREYGIEFENETFSIFPYYWGGCTCRYHEKEMEWSRKNPHQKTCSLQMFETYEEELEKTGITSTDDRTEMEWEKRMAAFGKEKGYDDWEKAQYTCTCGNDDAFEKWIQDNAHEAKCPLLKPNFHYKPNNFRIEWYKYPLRDAYMSGQKLTLDEFERVIDECIESLSNEKRSSTKE